MRPRFVERGKATDFGPEMGLAWASMRPRFVERGKRLSRLAKTNQLKGFNEAALR